MDIPLFQSLSLPQIKIIDLKVCSEQGITGRNIKKTSMMAKVWSTFWGGRWRENTGPWVLQSPIPPHRSWALLGNASRKHILGQPFEYWSLGTGSGTGVEGWLESPEGWFLLLSWEHRKCIPMVNVHDACVCGCVCGWSPFVWLVPSEARMEGAI